MFIGRHDVSVDPKGRIHLPAKIRDALKKSYAPPFIVTISDRCLTAHPAKEWLEKYELLEQEARTPKERGGSSYKKRADSYFCTAEGICGDRAQHCDSGADKKNRDMVGRFSRESDRRTFAERSLKETTRTRLLRAGSPLFYLQKHKTA